MSYHTPRKCVKIFHWIDGYLAAKDNCDSWRMCTISAKCRTIMIAVLMVMSGMGPHTISETWDVFGCWLGVSQSCGVDQTTVVDSVVGSMSCFEEKNF
jgi:hypothetical protein